MAEVDGHPIGFIQVIDPAREESRYWGDCAQGFRAIDVWIGDPARRGRRFGSAMMRLALARCFADPTVHAVLVDNPLTLGCPLRERRVALGSEAWRQRLQVGHLGMAVRMRQFCYPPTAPDGASESVQVHDSRSP